MSLILIAAGGALGSAARYLLAGFVHRFSPPFFPYGTFVVNIVGCLAFGVVVGLANERGAIGADGRAFLMIGLLGGFTTFSAFGFETFELLRAAKLGSALANAAGQTVLGVLSIWAGLALSRVL